MERLRKFKGSLLGKSRKGISAKIRDDEEAPSSRAAAAPSSSPTNASVTTIVAQLASSDAASSIPSCSLDPWTRAYEMFQGRESELAADYKNHLASLQEDPQSDLDLATPLAVESIVKRLLADREKKQWQIPLLGKDIKVREQVERLVKFVLWSDEIVKSALSAQPYAALAWSGVSMALPLLTSGTKHNEAMLKGFNSISDLQVYWRISEKTFLQSSHGQDYRDLVELLAKLYSHIVEYQARVICHLSSAQLSRAWHDVTAENDWDSLANEVNKLSKICSDCIPPLREQELRQHRDNQLQEIKESRSILSKIRRILEEDGKQSQRLYEDQTERNPLRDLVSDYESYKSFNTQRVAGTCEWFFDDDRFDRWRDSSTSSLLWVSAGPGCGKSVLSRALIDEQRLSTHVTTSTVCHFFFKDGDQRRMSSTNALKNSEKLMENLSELWGILENCAKSSNAGEIVCLFDALDECSSRMELIEQLKRFYTEQAKSPSRPSKLKFLITSRPYDDLDASFRMFSDTATYLRFDGDDKSEQIGREINLVIDARMCDIGYGLTDEGRRIISERLKSMKNRTYLWLHLTFDIIKQSPSEYSRRQDIEKLLSDLPAQVSDAYEKILSRSKESEKTIALLQIMLAAARPLSLDEANVALTLALEKQWYTSFAEFEEDKWHDPESFKIAVKNLCGLLISVYDSRLFFLHQTVREFLTAGPDSQDMWKGKFNTYQSHGTLSLSCLRLQYLSRSDTSLEYRWYPFLSYAVSNWLSHYIENKIPKDLEECHHHLWNLARNARQSKQFKRFEDSQVHIAIIDNGMDVHSLTERWNNISTGKTFFKVEFEDTYRDWFAASDLHGTQVATIIRKVNPFCRLYILRVGESHKDAVPINVAKAVNFAISHQVDIVSISCEIKTDSHLLQEANKKAMKATSDLRTKPRPMIFRPSANDSVDGDTFPACYGNTMSVAAHNICGHLTPSNDSNDIVVPGEDFEADANAPVEVKRYVSEIMSSAAPALAAGIASLALLLLRTHNDDYAVFNDFLQKDKIMQVFERMGNGQSGIQISRLFGNLGGDDIVSRWKIANFS
ncbi:hypothetical protein ACHAPE_004994 [Trichoderma viride]